MRATARLWAASFKAPAAAKLAHSTAGRRRLAAAAAFGATASLTYMQQRPSFCLSASVPKENSKAEVLSSPGIHMLMTVISDKRTDQAEYVRTVNRLMAILRREWPGCPASSHR